MPSILQDWVTELPLREQGTLLTVIRGCDLTPKYPLESPERRLVAYLRYLILVPADPREVELGGSFMTNHYEQYEVKAARWGHYPLHYVMHLVHAIEVIAYRHPSANVRVELYNIYMGFVRSFHLTIETADEMITRLSEDRIASGTVVS